MQFTFHTPTAVLTWQCRGKYARKPYLYHPQLPAKALAWLTWARATTELAPRMVRVSCPASAYPGRLMHVAQGASLPSRDQRARARPHISSGFMAGKSST